MDSLSSTFFPPVAVQNSQAPAPSPFLPPVQNYNAISQFQLQPQQQFFDENTDWSLYPPYFPVYTYSTCYPYTWNPCCELQSPFDQIQSYPALGFPLHEGHHDNAPVVGNNSQKPKKKERKQKHPRVCYSEYQKSILLQRFSENHWITLEERKRLGEHLQLTPEQVKIWFQNQRYKTKMAKKKEEAPTDVQKSQDNVFSKGPSAASC